LPQTLTQQAYNMLHDRLFTGGLSAGMRISDNDLSRDLGMSRTPVRQAILQLEAEGIVERHPKAGFRIRRPDPRELIRLFEQRSALETQAARLAASRITDHQIEELEQYCDQVHRISEVLQELKLDQLDGALARKINELDARFHLLIFDAAQSPGLLRMASSERIFSRIFGYLNSPLRQDPAQLVTDRVYHWHIQILDALKQRDAEAASESMHLHMSDAIKALTHRAEQIEQGDGADEWPASFVKQIAEIEKRYTEGATDSINQNS